MGSLAGLFRSWYKTFQPKCIAVVVSAKDTEVGDVVEVAGAGEAAAAAPQAKRVRYIRLLHLDVKRW